MIEDLGWQDWGCLQHTSNSLPCKVKCQGHLATKWWAHRVCHIGVYGICHMQLTQCWHDPGQWAGQLGWSSLGGDVWTHRGATHYLKLWCWPWCGVRLFPYCWHLQTVVPLYMLHYTVRHRHHLPQSFLGEHLLQFHNQLHQWTTHHMGVFPQCWLVPHQLSSPFHGVDDGRPSQLHLM